MNVPSKPPTSDDALIRTVSTKGQIVPPKPVRERLGWRAGDKLIVENTPAGVLLRRKPQRPPTRIEDVFCVLKYDGPRISDEGMNRAIGRHLAERWERFERTGTDYEDEDEV